ncbi:MAG: hypothetical protein MZW92_12900 [Comamonadaceae bacterium]|nr:hypothetical protein [Comamonadaceae bacterium]
MTSILLREARQLQALPPGPHGFHRAGYSGLAGSDFALANSEVNGRYIFSGSDVLNAPFIMAGDAVTYQGDMNVNSVEVAPGYFIRQNLPGDAVFSPLFNTINGLLTALDSGDQAAARTALAQFSGATSEYQSGQGANRLRSRHPAGS